MTAPTIEELQVLARPLAGTPADLDRRQLRFNEIVQIAMAFYPRDPAGGVRELVDSCDRRSPSYVPKAPMWEVLAKQYRWMVDTNPIIAAAGQRG